MLQFLAWYDPSTWLTSISSGIMGAMEIGIRTLSFSLATIVYKLIIYLYDMFEILCKGRLLDNEILETLSTRIGLILGIVMFFNIVFSMIKMLLEPDKVNDKEMGAGAILKKVIIVIVMLGVSNFVFDTLYNVQKVVVESHVISNLLLPYKIEDDDLDNFGKVLAEELMYAFYQLEEFDGITLDNEAQEIKDSCENSVKYFRNQIISTGNFNMGYNCLNESVKVSVNTGTGAGVKETDTFVINYNWVLCILAGGVTAYMLFMYCFKVGVRMIQLMFLEIISPVAIVSYLSPKKDTMFSKWSKIYVATYIDVFLRIVIINFVIFLIATIFSTSGGDGHFIFWESIGGKPDDFASVSFITVVIILALLTFAKKAPDLLKDLFPASASKLGFGTSMKDIVGLQKGINMAAGLGAASAVGLIGGAAGGKGFSRFTGAIGGALGGALRGAKAGYGAKGMFGAMNTARQNQAKANLARAQRIYSGATMGDNISSWYHDFTGSLNPYQLLEGEVNSLNELKADIEGEDAVKYAQQAHDVAWSEYVKNGGKATLEDWEEGRDSNGNVIDSGNGARVTKALKTAKDKTYAELYGRNGAFTSKVKMHNRRFGSRYNEKSHWNDVKDSSGKVTEIGINTTRKSKGDELEKLRAQKPKK